MPKQRRAAGEPGLPVTLAGLGRIGVALRVYSWPVTRPTSQASTPRRSCNGSK